MTSNMKETIPAEVPVGEIAAQLRIHPIRLCIAFARAASAGYIVNLGLGVRLKVEILDEGNLSAEAKTELAHVETLVDCEEIVEVAHEIIATREREADTLWAAPSASGRIQ
jgi:hypothetical protein